MNIAFGINIAAEIAMSYSWLRNTREKAKKHKRERSKMKTFVFFACVLLAVFQTGSSFKYVDEMQLFLNNFAKCGEELGVELDYRADIGYCMVKKRGLLDEQGIISKEKVDAWFKIGVLNKKKQDEMKEYFASCHDEAIKTEESADEINMKTINCVLSYHVMKQIFQEMVYQPYSNVLSDIVLNMNVPV